MADNVNAIAAKLGARVIGEVPDAGGGAFGAARLARAVAELRTGTVSVPVAAGTLDKLARLAERASANGPPVRPADLAARLLEAAVAAAPEA
ncbi:MAG: hypothetical protein K2X82_24130 [Gemmataceae bacterium]|nr:hypothetical protein [Gemmataceae bacterium]